MNIFEKFIINENQSIDILLPDVEDRTNSWYRSTQNLHKFDFISAALKQENISVVIVTEVAEEMFISLADRLEYVLAKKEELPDQIRIGEVGYRYHVDSRIEHEKSIDDYCKFTVWSGGFSEPRFHTWLYKKNNTIYFEISPEYPWLSTDPTEEEKLDIYISFDQFMKTYKPILVVEIDKAIAQKWLDSCRRILDDLEKGHIALLEQLDTRKKRFIEALEQHEIDLKGGEVNYSDLDIAFDQPVGRQLLSINDGDGAVITYKDDNHPEHVVEIIADTKLAAKNIFNVSVAKYNNWDWPIFTKNTADIQELFVIVQEAINCVLCSRADGDIQ